MSRLLLNPFDPFNVAVRQKAIAKTGKPPSMRNWVEELLERERQGEILTAHQLDMLKPHRGGLR